MASGDKELPAELEDLSLAVREGHEVAVVIRAGQAIFAINKTTNAWSARKSALVAWGDTAIFCSMLIFAAGVLGLLPLGGGAPIGGWVTLMILSPLPTALLVVRARKLALRECWQLVGGHQVKPRNCDPARFSCQQSGIAAHLRMPTPKLLFTDGRWSPAQIKVSLPTGASHSYDQQGARKSCRTPDAPGQRSMSERGP